MIQEKNKKIRLEYLNNLQRGYRIKSVFAFLLGIVLGTFRDSFAYVLSFIFALIGLGYLIAFLLIPIYIDHVGFGKE